MDFSNYTLLNKRIFINYKGINIIINFFNYKFIIICSFLKVL